jgi:ribosomal protein L13E
MDKQETHNLIARLLKRLDRSAPQPLLIYGRRTAPAAGFSLAEIAEAGLSQDAALKLGLKVDAERMSSLGTNVENLHRFLLG